MKQLIKNTLTHLAAGLGQHRFSSTAPHLWVLMYHRILPVNDARYAFEEPGMIVTPETFRQHLQTLKSLFELMPLSEWIARRNADQSLPRRACAITFDDGWLDNYQFAFPILIEEQVPATLFAVSHMIGTTRQFWPNRFTRLLAARSGGTPLPAFDDIIDLSNQPVITRDLLADFILRLKVLSDTELDDRLDRAEQGLQLAAEKMPALMSWDNVRAMCNSDLVEIGSHTCNHFRLQQQLSDAVLLREIRDSRTMIEQQIERPVTLFCYPNGDTSKAAIDLVGQHYQGAVTTRRGINNAASKALELTRIGIHEDITNTRSKFEARLSGLI